MSSAVKVHHLGQPEVNFTTPEANIKRNKSQRINQKVKAFCGPDSNSSGIRIVDDKTVKSPASRSKISHSVIYIAFNLLTKYQTISLLITYEMR
jgi:hypothetical protein